MSNFVSSITLQFKDAFSNGIQRAIGGAQSSVKKLTGTVKSMSNGSQFLQTAANVSAVSGHVSGMARNIAGATDTWSTAASGFESSMAAVRSSLVMSVGPGKVMETQFHQLRAAARAWSSENADSASAYAQTSYMMLSAGLNTEDAIQGTNAALTLARATMGDATEAGNLLATAYNNMKRDGESAEAGMGRLGDVIAKTQSMFQIASLNQLGEGLKYAVADAKPAGMQMEQVSTIIGALNTAGLQGSQAGTAFAASLRNIDKAGKNLGFDVMYDEAGGLNFIKTLENIQKKFGDIETRTVAQRQAFTAAFGDEGVRVINLLGANVQGLQRNFDLVRDATGASATMAGAMADTYEQRMQTAQNAIEKFRATMGAGANTVRLFGAELGATVAGALNVMPPAVGGVVGMLGQVVSVGASATSGIISFTTGLASVMFMADKFPVACKMLGLVGRSATGAAQGVLALGRGIIVAIPAIISWTASAWAAAAAHIAVAWPVYAVIGGIAILGAGIFLLVKHWHAVVGVIKGAVIGSFNFLKNVLIGVAQWFSRVAENPLIAASGVLFAPLIAIPVLIMKHWEPIKNFFAGLFGTVGKVIGAVGSFLGFGKEPEAVSKGTGMRYGGARAMGGTVHPGLVYTVGERGVEHFVPATAGSIVPNRDVQRTHAPSSAGQTVNVHIDTVRMDAPHDIQQMFDFFGRLSEEFGLR